MGFMDSFKGKQLATKAYRLHVTAAQLRQNGKYQEAEAKFNEAYRLYGEAYADGNRKGTILIGYGILAMQKGEFERARELFLESSKDKSLSQDDRFSMRVNFGICQWKLGKLDKAIETLRNAAQTKLNGTVYTTLGLFLIEQARKTGDLEEAIRFNQEALEYDDEDASQLDNMGELCMLQAERARAEGDAAAAKERHDQALDYFRKAYELKPDQITSAYYLACFEHEGGNDAAARKILEKALTIPFSAVCPVE